MPSVRLLPPASERAEETVMCQAAACPFATSLPGVKRAAAQRPRGGGQLTIKVSLCSAESRHFTPSKAQRFSPHSHSPPRKKPTENSRLALQSL